MSNDTRQQVVAAVQAVENKKGEDLVILEMDRKSGAFTDYFIVCTGTNPRQIQAISDEVQKQVSDNGTRPNSVEGYNQAEWVLLDYVDFVVHIFSDRARKFYDLERLWKSAKRLTPAELEKRPAKAKPAAKKAVKKTASTRSAKAKSTAGPRTAVRTKRTSVGKKKK
jgi:ribosome-associated protein